MGMVVDVGVVKNHIKPKADSTLYNMRKADLIEYIRTLEHNYNVAVSFNENQAKYVESLGVLPKWIPVSERLPELMENVLLLLTCDDTAVGYRCDKFWRVAWTNGKLDNNEVTHWMPLPEPPKEENR